MHHLVLAVLLVVQAATNQHHFPAVLDMVVMQPSFPVEQPTNHHHQTFKYNNMLLMLKVFL
jgi:hypothetical protein